MMTPTEAIGMVDDLIEFAESQLNTWERDFLSDVREGLINDEIEMTEGRENKLNQIWDKYIK